jgi:hypothetical protein
MNLSRRTLLASVSAVAIAPLIAACSATPDIGAIERVLTTHFGAEIARSDSARRFAVDLSTHLAKSPICSNPWNVCDTPDTRIVQSFLESTTFLAAQANGSDFDYVTIFEPWTSPCSSQLVAPL